MNRILALLVAGLVASAGSSAEASPPPDGAARFRLALADLDALAKETRVNGELPRLTMPRAAEIFGRLFDDRAALGAPPYGDADMPVLLEMLEKANSVAKAYLAFAPKPGETPDGARNLTAYQDEVTAAQVFLLKTVSAVMPATAAFVGAMKPEELDEARSAGARQLRSGLIGVVTGSALLLRSPDYRPDNQERLAAALADAADEIGAGAPEPDRRAIAAAAETALAGAAPAARPKLEAFVSAVKAAPCDALCAVK